MMQTILTSETHTIYTLDSDLALYTFFEIIIHQQAFTVMTLVSLVEGTPRCTDNVCDHGLLLWN